MIQPQALFIEAGHGKGPSGAVDPGVVRKLVMNGKQISITERELTVAIAGRVLDQLTSRRRDPNAYLIQGVGIATAASVAKKMEYVNTVIGKNRFDPKRCFGIAIHINSAGSGGARGCECWYQKNNLVSAVLGEFVVQSQLEYSQIPLRTPYLKSSINSRFGRYVKGKWNGRLYIDDAKCPYALIECGFISNNEDLSILQQKTDRVALGIAHGIKEFFRNHTL